MTEVIVVTKAPQIERIEKDPLGPVSIPADAYYGPQTARGIANFPISGIRISHFPNFIRSLAYVKMAAARANAALGDLDKQKADVICQVCAEIAAGRHLGEFPLDVFQGGAGTSTNMNVNEVIANRGLEIMGLPRGQYDQLHPNNDVNFAQSTNDIYPTAIRLAILLSRGALQRALGQLASELEGKAETFSDVIKLGRTQLQDAVPMTLGQEFQAFATTLREDVARLGEIGAFFHEINLGGTAIGTGINTNPRYQAAAVAELRAISGLPVVPAGNLIEACWDTGAFVLFSGMLKRTATKLSKICNDLRLLSSGPRGGLNEINLPALQPGSSIMPGKVNPVVPEVVNQVAFQIIGYDLTITLASEAGQLQLNVMEPVIAYNILHSLELLTNAVDVLRTKCVAGITANAETCRRHLEASTAGATALTPAIGYDRAAELAKLVLSSGKTIHEVLAEQPDLSEELIAQAADPHLLTRPTGFTTAGRRLID
ncbi:MULTISPECIES: aspartate ammonia-lyase [unclassified Mesorhizobium]|uniref:aspartate ammonia-lyase n=1 Tax=unclassified Mesorhizobium TaxID=325217 RepID=UPI000FE942DF|nr:MULTISPECIES: aspartate ammonia-lyase [unclassified Mesorhizobium]RWE83110.1 MAG: aspartate ammonia-lyase [Mesorhizobium sp.]TGQ85746.1 aspartate ammonia-lyase [Mesorhizobium sp. M8A.F.Ca.ET.208.01.1.1]TGT47632.1 aspartate ammonia-lyase [Mesorhizobium sp. M8A.F.Ca.ET.167.01.1.1]TIR04684.1 MAG: aspartate ammonia-lyase [Mesorhizobium sp.]